MWHFIKSDISYYRSMIAVLFVMMALFFFVQRYTAEDLDFMAVILVFVLVNPVNTCRIKEKRDRQHALLPLSIGRIAAGRLLSVLFPCLAGFVFYTLLHILFEPDAGGPPSHGAHFEKMMVQFGIALLIFSIFFILRDVYFFSTRSRMISRMGGSSFLIMFLLGFMVLGSLGLYAFTATSETGKPPAFLVYMMDWTEKYNPFGGYYGAAKFLIFSLLFSSLSILSFCRRKSFVE